MTRPRAIALKVAQHRARVVSNIAKVDGLPADAQQEKPVEHLEQLAGRLVDRAQDRLPGLVRELAQERDDRPRALRVQSGRRFVEEQEQAGLKIALRRQYQTGDENTRTLATSSTAIVVRLRCSTLSVPTMASAYATNPHISKHFSTLQTQKTSVSSNRARATKHKVTH